MLMFGVADMPPQEPAPIVAEVVAKNLDKDGSTIGACLAVPPEQTEPQPIAPIKEAMLYVDGDKLVQSYDFRSAEAATVRWLELPKHGKLVDAAGKKVSAFKEKQYHYVPNAGYRGADRIVVEIRQLLRYKLKLVYTLHVGAATGDNPCEKAVWYIARQTSTLYLDGK
jgi:hypothetical protein